MKIHQILSISGGIVLLGSTFFPAHGTTMWGALELLDRDVLLGALPLVMSLAGVLGAILGSLGKGTFTIFCGGIALLWMLFAIRFQLFVMIVLEPFFLLSLIGGVLIVAAGIIGLNKRSA